jgi:hypothetical protein
VDRYYDPSTDQFLSVDPDLAETGQPYAFTGDDPLNATDPLGLSPGPASWNHNHLPDVTDRRLRNILKDNLFKYDPNEKKGVVGNGSSVDAVMEEAMTGEPTNKKWHIQQLVNGLRGVSNRLNSGELDPADRLVAEQTLTYGRPAVVEFDRAVDAGNVKGLSSELYDASVERFGSNIAQSSLGIDDAGIPGLGSTAVDAGIPGDSGGPGKPPEIPGLDG